MKLSSKTVTFLYSLIALQLVILLTRAQVHDDLPDDENNDLGK